MSSPPVSSVLPPDLLLCVFIHGFKGNDETFGGFPARLRHVLTETLPNTHVECVVFPHYETKGELNVAVETFADWLATLTVEKEVAHAISAGAGAGAGKAKIVLCGHSMGGLLAADAFLAIARSQKDVSAPLWPRVIACLAFDTPYLGIHPFVFKNTATKAMGYVQTARDVASGVGVLGALGAGFGFGKGSASAQGDSNNNKKGEENKGQEGRGISTSQLPETNAQGSTVRSGWAKWAPTAYGVGGALLAGAAVGAAYYKRDDVSLGWTWAGDHLQYVKNLWDEKALKERVDDVVRRGEELRVVFRIFYTHIPGNPPEHPKPRTFIILPDGSSGHAQYFIPAHNGLAPDEVAAHTGMFDASSNDGYYDLGLRTAQAIEEAVVLDRGRQVVGGN